MATIDASIPLQGRLPQIDSPVNALAKVTQLRNAQNQNRLFDMQVAESERKQQRQNALMQATRGAFDPATGRIDPGKYRSALGDLGDYAGIQEFDKTQAEQEKLSAEGDAKKFEIATKRFDYYKKALGSLAQDPGLSKDMVMQAGQSLVQQGILPAEMYQQSIQNLPDDIEQLRARLRQGVAQQLTPEQMLTVFSPKAEKIDNGQQIGYRDMNPNSPTYGQATGGAPVQKQMTPGEVATNARGIEANRLKGQENSINEQGIVGKKIQDVELKLQDDYRTESKGFSETATAMKKVLGAISTANKNPGSALAAGTAFMKLLDPNSVVRESELGMALNASGWFDRAMNIANTLQAGKVMTPKQQVNLSAAAETLFEEAKAAQLEVDAAYEQRAKAYGADPSRVIVDRGQKTAKVAKTPPAAGGIKPFDADKEARYQEWKKRNGQ